VTAPNRHEADLVAKAFQSDRQALVKMAASDVRRTV
jgi:hypothetical protein